MAYLGIDVERVGMLTETLRFGATVSSDAQECLAQAELLADEPTGCAAALDDIATDFSRLADRIDWAATTVNNLQLAVAPMFEWDVRPVPIRTPVPVPPAAVLGRALLAGLEPAAPASPPWNATAGQPWHAVHQVSSHNSYEVPGGIQLLFDQGLRSFELDVHRRAPIDHVTQFLPSVAETGAGGAAPVWHVYHATGVSFSEYDTLRQGLAAVAAVDTLDPLTVFIDSKDGFDGAHTFDAFDQVLIDELGDRLFTPAAFQSGARVASPLLDDPTLLDVAQSGAWPHVEALQGRVIVVLTDEIDGYARPMAHAFVAPPPQFTETSPGVVIHMPQADAIFYNANSRSIGPHEIAAVHASGTMLRTYFNPQCATDFLGQESPAAHYRAVDVSSSEPVCEPRKLAPPIDGPGPG